MDIFIVEDDADIGALIAKELSVLGHRPVVLDSFEGLFCRLENGDVPDIIIIDQHVGSEDAVSGMVPKALRHMGFKGQLILHTHILEQSLEAAGFSEFVMKSPFTDWRLALNTVHGADQ